MDKLKIYKASAGSGKTHTLTSEYLKLAASYPDHFKKILAVTFTNKAAEEMKQRILESLNDIILKGDGAGFYPVFKNINGNDEKEKILEQAKKVRDNILHDYSFFSLGTIDSFVQKVIKSFTYEIGIESGYRIELDTDKVIKDLTELLYKQIDTDPNLRTWLIHFANFKMDDGKSWDFRGEIARLAKEIFKEQFQSFGEIENEQDFNQILEYFNELNAIKQGFEKKMADLGAKTLLKISECPVNLQNHSRNVGSVFNYLTKNLVNPQNQDSYQPTATVLKMAGEPEAWCNKTSGAQLRDESRIVFQTLNPILENTLEFLDREYQFYLSAINILSAFHAFGILNKLSSLLPAYRSDNNLLLISDTTRILKEIIAGNDAPFIYEKIGNRYHHILIDEFQDTSGFQWENFKPLIKNSLSEGKENLIVGDMKQSIYRWRGGDWNILMSKLETDIGGEYISQKNLDTNWRSKKNILDFNNLVFSTVSDQVQQIFNEELNDGVAANLDEFDKKYREIISKAYTDVCQKLPDESEKKGGRVKIKFFRQEKGDNKENLQEKVADELPRLIDQLLTQKNYIPGDIAILVRRNIEGRQVANILLGYQQSNPEAVRYQIISSESLMLINSPAVQLVINAMYYLFDPDDLIHLHALVVNVSSLKNPAIDFNHQHFDVSDRKQVKDFIPMDFFSRFDELKKLNVYELSEKLSHIFKLVQFDGQLAYLQTFQDIILEFGLNDSVDLASFLNWWEDKGKTFAVQLAEQQDAIKILSIHKSKGLAFKIVIIPYCDWDLKPQPNLNNIIWTSTDISPFNRFKRFPVMYRSYLRKSIFWKEYYNELLYTMIDALNMLYVAFTRPREELHILAPVKEKKDNKISTVADLLYQCMLNPNSGEHLVELKKYWFPELEILEIKPDYSEMDAEKKVPEKTDLPSITFDDFATGDWNDKIRFIHYADEFFIESLEYIKTHVDYGKLMHALFSKINSLKDADQVIDEFYYAGKIGTDDRDQITLKVKEMIHRPEVADWFSDKWKIKTEDAILDVSGKIRIPDRVLIGKNQTLVIDFKFGEQYAGSVDQVKEYMELLKSMNYPGVKGFIYYAEKNIIEEVSFLLSE